MPIAHVFNNISDVWMHVGHICVHRYLNIRRHPEYVPITKKMHKFWGNPPHNISMNPISINPNAYVILLLEPVFVDLLSPVLINELIDLLMDSIKHQCLAIIDLIESLPVKN